jgi:acyl-CoA reductase-like NAD-dependent aldehyde dehydrogenase
MTSAAAIAAGLDAYPLAAGTRRFLGSTPLGHFIEGEAVPSLSGETFADHEPGTGREFARVASGGGDDVDRAVRSARAAFEDGRWRDLAPAEREKRLRRLAVLLADNRDALMDLDVLDGGVVRTYSHFLVEFAIALTDYYAGWPTKLHGAIPATVPGLVVQEVREPIGVIGAIMPWNGPSAVPLGVVPAIACGNSVVLKPAEQTPLAPILVAQLAIEAGIPPGVFNVIQGPGEITGAALVDHPMVDAISFTGSVETGRRIQAAAAARLKRVSLELGGKSPHIVFADADLEKAAQVCAGAVWGHSGQVCTAGSRVLVQDKIHDKLVDAIVSVSAGLKIGSGFDPQTQIGPLISEQQLDRVCRYVAIGRREGADLALGGNRHGDIGYFHEPTIFTSVRNDMTIAREEIFGPVMAVIPFETEEEAYAIANDTEFGLSAGVWTRDLARAHRATRRLKAGTVWVNTYQRVDPAVPYGGVKQSGFGRSLGAASIEELTQVKSVWIDIG